MVFLSAIRVFSNCHESGKPVNTGITHIAYKSFFDKNLLSLEVSIGKPRLYVKEILPQNEVLETDGRTGGISRPPAGYGTLLSRLDSGI
jgi:hypothetical protein